jgi:GIY-YIG catalytic domain-containing protein/zinc knuckle protein
MFIYILQLEKGKYYVGKTGDVKRRIQQHRDGKGAYWTKKYQMLDVIDVIEHESDEDKYVIDLMIQYGIQNVRGGSFSKVVLTSEDIRFANRMMRTKEDLCYKCGKPGHFAMNCYIKTRKKPTRRSNQSIKECERCGRSHITSKCYAKTDIRGKSIKECKRCGRSGHITSKCYAKTDINGTILYIETPSSRDYLDEDFVYITTNSIQHGEEVTNQNEYESSLGELFRAIRDWF